MEVTKTNSAHLCNFEVMQLLRSVKDTKRKYSTRNLATITYETLQYLDESPCKEENEESIAKFLKATEPYKLTNNEKLLMVNNPPTKPLQIQLIVDESEERLTEEQVDSLLATVAEHLPVPEEQEVETE